MVVQFTKFISGDENKRVQFAVITVANELDRASLFIARRHETTATFMIKERQSSNYLPEVASTIKTKKEAIQRSIRLQDTLCHILRKDRMRTYLRTFFEKGLHFTKLPLTVSRHVGLS